MSFRIVVQIKLFHTGRMTSMWERVALSQRNMTKGDVRMQGYECQGQQGPREMDRISGDD
jgi:hypothetical protein